MNTPNEELPIVHFNLKGENPLTVIEVGFLQHTIPDASLSTEPMLGTAKKLVFLMDRSFEQVHTQLTDDAIRALPDGLYPHASGYGGFGWHPCDIGGDCGQIMNGEFALKEGSKVMVFPVGVIHLIVDHNWIPDPSILQAISHMPDPPPNYTGTVQLWLAPNKQGLFQISSRSSK